MVAVLLIQLKTVLAGEQMTGSISSVMQGIISTQRIKPALSVAVKIVNITPEGPVLNVKCVTQDNVRMMFCLGVFPVQNTLKLVDATPLYLLQVEMGGVSVLKMLFVQGLIPFLTVFQLSEKPVATNAKNVLEG